MISLLELLFAKVSKTLKKELKNFNNDDLNFINRNHLNNKESLILLMDTMPFSISFSNIRKNRFRYNSK
jgi:hypothetical protein